MAFLVLVLVLVVVLIVPVLVLLNAALLARSIYSIAVLRRLASSVERSLNTVPPAAGLPN